jgi:phosphoglycerate dehydrogenase-like enzyme
LDQSSRAGNTSALIEIDDSSRISGARRRSGDLEPVSTALLVREEFRNMVFSRSLIEEIGELAGAPAKWIDPEHIADGRETLAEAEVLFATWGTPKMDEAFLDAAPRLKAILYAAGSPKSFLTPEVFERGITVCTAAAANAIPVAEFTVSSIILSLKRVWQTMRETHLQRSWIKPEFQAAGTYGSRVGLISLGAIGRLVAGMLATFDLEVLAYDPHISPEDARALGVKPASLPEIFASCDVVSLHTPLLASTTGMIDRSLLTRMKPNATLINTSRGGIICQDHLCQVLRDRPDLTAVLDVTEPEPPSPTSPLWELPNVFVTPHISGSIGPECLRMGRYMVDEFQRLLRGEPFRHQVTPQSLALMA